MEGTLAQVIMFAGNFAPRNWAFCAGQLVAISSNSALFSLLGTIYGGDGRTTFQLPDLRGRTPIGAGNGPGLTSRREGQRGGEEYHTLIASEMPSHSHTHSISNRTGTAVAQLQAGSGRGTVPANGGFISADDTTFKATGSSDKIAGLSVDLSSLNFDLVVNNTGGSQSHNNMQPWLAINFVICTQGIFPSRS